MSSSLDTLTEINVDDLLDAAGLARWRHTPLRRLFRRPARRFAHIAQAFDRAVAERGLAAGSAWMVERMSGGLQVHGAQHIPAQGPLCVLANHPGMTDTVALIASLGTRPDLRVIALDRPFLRALPAVAPRLIFVPAPDEAGHESARLAVVRQGVEHLRRGGALLTFPAAHIEPDPALAGAPPALASLADWSASFALFVRRVPRTVVLPALASHVLDAGAQAHPLTCLRRRAEDREKLGAALQVALTRYQRGRVRVAFGTPVPGDGRDAGALRLAVLDEMARLIAAAAGDAPRPRDRMAPAQQRPLWPRPWSR